MDKLKLNLTGRMPLLLEDLEFQDTYFREAIEGILKAYDNVPNVGFVVSGCQFTAPNLSAGFIYLNGELIKVNAQTVNSASGSFYITRTASDTTARIFGDETQKNVRTEVRGVGGYYMVEPTAGVSLNDTLIKRIMSLPTNDVWATQTLNSGYSHGSPTLRYRLNKIGHVEISGVVYGPAQGTIATLASLYKPPEAVKFPVITAAGYPNLCTVNTSGVISLSGIPQNINDLTGDQYTYIHITLFMS